jgi:hypothetical protein
MTSIIITACESRDSGSPSFPGEHWIVSADVLDGGGLVLRSVTHEFESSFPASEIVAAVAQRVRDGFGQGVGAEIVGQEMTL